MLRRLALILTSAALLTGSAAAVVTSADDPTASAAVVCTKVAATTGSDSNAGTEASPYRTISKLATSLSSGQVGCLRQGTYSADVTVANAGITLTSFPSERATVNGRLYIRRGANAVTVSNLNLRSFNSLPSPTINANDAKFIGNDVSNSNTGVCFIVGSSTYGRAARTLISQNRIHNCGELPSGNQDHGIYVQAADDTRIVDNVIYRNVDRGVQLYPDAQRTIIRGNIIDSNGEGIIFSGAGGVASNNNTVDHNLITSSNIRADIESWYPSGNPKGVGNVATQNCLVPGKGGAINTSNGGFSAFDNLIVTSAKYLDSANGDFRLAADSPCIPYISDSTAPAGPNGEPPVSASQPDPYEATVGDHVVDSTDGKKGEVAYVSKDGNRTVLLLDDSTVRGAKTSSLTLAP